MPVVFLHCMDMKPHIEPITKPVFKLGQPDDNYKYRPLPSPTGKYPYHLNIQDVYTTYLGRLQVG